MKRLKTRLLNEEYLLIKAILKQRLLYIYLVSFYTQWEKT